MSRTTNRAPGSRYGRALALLAAILIAPFIVLAFLVTGSLVAPVLVMVLPGYAAALWHGARPSAPRDRGNHEDLGPAGTAAPVAVGAMG